MNKTPLLLPILLGFTYVSAVSDGVILTPPHSEDDRITEGKVTSIIANSLFGVSGLVAALGVYYLFRDVGPDSIGETRINKIAVTPTLGPRSAGLSGQWRF